MCVPAIGEKTLRCLPGPVLPHNIDQRFGPERITADPFARLGMPRSVIAAARENLTEREKQLAEHLARVDHDLRALEQERRQAVTERMAVAEAERRARPQHSGRGFRERGQAVRHR